MGDLQVTNAAEGPDRMSEVSSANQKLTSSPKEFTGL